MLPVCFLNGAPSTLSLMCTGAGAGTKVLTGRCMVSCRLGCLMGSVSSEAAGVACLHTCTGPNPPLEQFEKKAVTATLDDLHICTCPTPPLEFCPDKSHDSCTLDDLHICTIPIPLWGKIDNIRDSRARRSAYLHTSTVPIPLWEKIDKSCESHAG